MAEGGSYRYSHAGRNDRESEKEEEEEMYRQIEEMSVGERERKGAKCESCVRDKSPWYESPWYERYASPWYERYKDERRLYGRVAVYLCFVCEMYVCAECMPRHGKHEGMKVRRKESERQTDREESGSEKRKSKNRGLLEKLFVFRKKLAKKVENKRKEEEEESESDRVKKPGETDRSLEKFVDTLMGESELERKKKLKNSHAIVYDRVEVKHELDQTDCGITGLCGLENKRWVVCDCLNDCIKIFKVGSHVLQRYVRFVGFGPWDVTEIHLKQNSAEPNLVSGSRSDISATDWADLGKQCLIAVTLPWQHQIMVIDLSKKPAKPQKLIKTEGLCYSIQFYDDKIFTVCREGSVSPRYVCIKSTDGVTLNMFDTDSYKPYLAVVSGRVYLTDRLNNKVQRRNVEGQVISEFTIEWSGPVGMSVDPDNNVYVCAWRHNKVYKLDADLTRYKSVLDQTAGYIERPEALCCHRDKLFISHVGSPSLDNFVTVVRLL